MFLAKLYKYEPIKNFVMVQAVENGIICAQVCQRVLVRAKYANVTENEQNSFARCTLVEKINDRTYIVERTRVCNLATIYYRVINGQKEVFDIHYHKNGNKNGYRNEEQVIKDTNAILEECKFTQNLIIGAFMCNRITTRRTSVIKHFKKYIKL